ERRIEQASRSQGPHKHDDPRRGTPRNRGARRSACDARFPRPVPNTAGRLGYKLAAGYNPSFRGACHVWRMADDGSRALQRRLRSSGGPRGADKTFLNGMIMAMAQRPLGDGTFGLRAMLAPDPFMGANGYPLLFATGETADGRTHLIDRQHPHDLFMELATTYSYDLSKNSSVYVYAGLPGEPALGPSTFMHRTSGMDIPEAPIT